MKTIISEKRKYLFPVVHFLLTFLFERILFVFDGNWDVFNTLPRTDSVSNELYVSHNHRQYNHRWQYRI